jgi:predicted small metal-binding protein
MYKFVCDRVIPGCTTTESGDTEEEVRSKAARHMREHHALEDFDERMSERIGLGIMLLGK